jgi:hypothetical protein
MVGMNLLERLLSYLVASVVLICVGAERGAAYFDRICDSSDPEVTECDLAAVYALYGAAIALGACLVVVLLIEGTLLMRRKLG